MTVPVLRLLLQQHPGLHVTFVSAPFVAPMFDGIERLEFVGVDTKKDYAGLAGLSRLSRRLKKLHRFTAVADLHNVLRTKVLRLFLSGLKKAVIDKGRAEKKELTRPENKKLRQLKTGFERYADVFAALGYPVDLQAPYVNKPGPLPGLVPGAAGKKLVGIAPFARHEPKMYPLDKMKQVAEGLAAAQGIQVILFGSRAEAPVLETWVGENIYSVAGRISFHDELNLISQLDLMVSMDSANMHLASMYSVPVISIWGGTHPYLGFYGWRQPMANAIQLDLPCRPSSVFGNKPCPVHGERGCMQGISPAAVTAQCLEVISAM
ncbi:MAG: glycosyltransferase family 9 protein [Chitinophagaceae bacterium]|nr:MAG: glycosyltransferase family 9 protein [Chitinophagaceae bacterium]